MNRTEPCPEHREVASRKWGTQAILQVPPHARRPRPLSGVLSPEADLTGAHELRGVPGLRQARLERSDAMPPLWISFSASPNRAAVAGAIIRRQARDDRSGWRGGDLDRCCAGGASWSGRVGPHDSRPLAAFGFDAGPGAFGHGATAGGPRLAQGRKAGQFERPGGRPRRRPGSRGGGPCPGHRTHLGPKRVRHPPVRPDLGQRARRSNPIGTHGWHAQSRRRGHGRLAGARVVPRHGRRTNAGLCPPLHAGCQPS